MTKRVLILVLLVCGLLIPSVVLGADEWVSPTSHELSEWSNEENSYDDNTGTYASRDFGGGDVWSEWLTLNMDDSYGSNCTRVYSTRETSDINKIKIEVYSSLEWVEIYNGVLTVGEWVEYDYECIEVSKVRISYFNDHFNWFRWVRCHEVDIWWVECIAASYSIVVLPESDTNVVGSNHTLNATVSSEGSPVGGVGVTWNLTGVGELLWSEGITGEDGVAEARITSNVTGYSYMECYLSSNSSVSDSGSKLWVGAAVDVGEGFGTWMIAIMLCIVGLGWYTKSLLLGIVGVILCVVSYVWVGGFHGDEIGVYGASAFFLIILGWIVLNLIWREAH